MLEVLFLSAAGSGVFLRNRWPRKSIARPGKSVRANAVSKLMLANIGKKRF